MYVSSCGTLLSDVVCTAYRQLAKSQMVWHRREPYFQWVDMGKMADLARVVDAVADWVTNNQGFPHELDGTHLKELVSHGSVCDNVLHVFMHLSCCHTLHRTRQQRKK